MKVKRNVVEGNYKDVIDGLLRLSREIVRTTRRVETTVLGVGAVAYLVVLALLVPQTAATPAACRATLEPRLEALPAGSVVLVDDGIGAWMEWAVPECTRSSTACSTPTR